MSVDVPSPIDLRVMADARQWADTALAKRPCRTEFFDRFLQELLSVSPRPRRVLELGSGPGFLAEHILCRWPDELAYVALDFSPAMHQLAQERLGVLARSVKFIERNFKDPAWTVGLGSFDAVLTNQAVHELRHKRHAPDLHAQAHSVLMPDGPYLVCDHFAGGDGMKDQNLYMSVAEQSLALEAAGFKRIRRVHVAGGMALYCAT